jgi:polyribonucleotide 5'-hydroxyl-kinase
MNKSKCREYFYGRRSLQIAKTSGGASSLAARSSVANSVSTMASIQYSPSRLNVRLSDIKLLRAGGLQLSEGMRLIGETTSSNSLQLTRVAASTDLVNTLLGVLHVPEDLERLEDSVPINGNCDPRLLASNVAGFLCVVQVDLDHDSLTVLSPCPGQLPSKYLLVGSGLKWVE